jgi:4-amino-4-deoxy-L-arabinose transferase-like glycosyltransferase
MTRPSEPPIDRWILLAAVASGVAIRFVQLGALALNDAEAQLALQALKLAQGQSPALGSDAGYGLFTSLFFSLFGASNFGARFLPVLLGSLLVLAPWWLRRPLGRVPALILAFGLALDPGLVSLSRTAGSGLWAVTFAVFFAVALVHRRSLTAGILLGMALLGGIPVWAGAATVLVAWLAYWAFLSRRSGESEEGEQPESRIDGRSLLAGAAGSFILAGSLFFFRQEGLSAAFSGLPMYLAAWLRPSGLAAGELLLSLVVYQTLPLVFAAVQVVRFIRTRNPLDRLVILFTLAGLVLALLLPGRSYAVLLWPVLGLWTLAARALAGLFQVEREDRLWVGLLGGVVFFLLSFAWMNYLGLLLATQPADIDIRRLSILASLLLVGIAGLLVGWGWQPRVAARGVGLGVTAVLAIFLVSNATQSGGLSPTRPHQLWRSASSYPQAALIRQTIGDLARWKVGSRTGLDGLVAGIDSPALAWELRDLTDVDYVPGLTPQMTPSFAITRDVVTPTLSAMYRGTSLLLSQTPEWSAMTPGEWMRWLAYRKAPVSEQRVLIWARTDVFPGGQSLEENRAP